MLRPVLVAGGTIAGLVAVFSYRTHVPGTVPVAEASRPAVLATSAAPRASRFMKAFRTGSMTHMGHGF